MPWNGLMDKFAFVETFAAEQNPEHVIVFVDGFDTREPHDAQSVSAGGGGGGAFIVCGVSPLALVALVIMRCDMAR